MLDKLCDIFEVYQLLKNIFEDVRIFSDICPQWIMQLQKSAQMLFWLTGYSSTLWNNLSTIVRYRLFDSYSVEMKFYYLPHTIRGVWAWKYPYNNILPFKACRKKRGWIIGYTYSVEFGFACLTLALWLWAPRELLQVDHAQSQKRWSMDRSVMANSRSKKDRMRSPVRMDFIWNRWLIAVSTKTVARNTVFST